jgi:hypothetical protein
MKKRNYLLIIFGILLILFAIFSSKVSFHDSYEYITFSKNLAGIDNLNPFVAHSMLYPLIISLFIKIFPTFLTIKLINILWVF